MANTDTALEHHVHEHDHQGDAWSGAQSPFKVSYGKIMMWYFLLSDAFTFAGFLITYGALRFSSPTWPVPDFVFATDPFGLSPHTRAKPQQHCAVRLPFLLCFASDIKSITGYARTVPSTFKHKYGVTGK